MLDSACNRQPCLAGARYSATPTSGSRSSCCWPDSSSCGGSPDRPRPGATPPSPGRGHPRRARRRRLARRRRSAHQARHARHPARGHFLHYGARRVPGALEPARAGARPPSSAGRRASSAAPRDLGRARGLSLGRANTLTIFAIQHIGLSIAFPLWNANSLLGILWGTLLFNELRDAGPARWLGVLGGAAAMFAGATLLAVASSAHAPGGDALRGVAAALTAGALWGTMYIPYRTAYLTGMHPLSFVAFFTIGELGMMTPLALSFSGGPCPLWGELANSRAVLFWLLLAGFVWVVGDLFQQYAAKYVGISRGIPISNTNQLWGLVWGIAVFGELGGGSPALYWRVIGGSLLMAAGAGAIAPAPPPSRGHRPWQETGGRGRGPSP